MSQFIIPPRTYFVIFGTLMGLLVATVGLAYVDLGPFNLAVALSIAAVKAALIVMYFMHVRYSSRLTWIFAGASFLWLAILLAFSLADYLTRGWLSIQGK